MAKPLIDLYEAGESIQFNDARERTHGARSEGVVTLAPGRTGPPPHRHKGQLEGFRVTSGLMVATIDGVESLVRPGESALVRSGQAHTFRNGSEDEPLVMDAWFDPAGNAEWMLQSLGDLATSRGGSWSKAPLLESAYVMFRLRNEYRMVGMPAWVQDALFAPLAGLAKVTGRARRIPPPPVFRA